MVTRDAQRVESFGSPLIVMDEDLRVVRFNDAAARWAGLQATDIGAPFADEEGRLRSIPLKRLVRSVVRTSKLVERHIADDQRGYLLRIHPYGGEIAGRKGVVLTAVGQITEQFELMLDCLDANVALLDTNGIIVAVNRPWRNFAAENGCADPGFGVGVNYLEICESVTGPDSQAVGHIFRGIREVLNGTVPKYEFDYPCHHGPEKRWFRGILTATQFPHRGAVMVHRNTTAHVEAQHRLELQVAALESVPMAVTITDRNGRILWVNSAFTRMTGYSTAEAVGQPAAFLRSSRQDSAFWENLPQTKTWRGEIIHHRRDGTDYTVQQTITPITSPAGEVSNFVIVQEDITHRKETEKRILHVAQHDWLTGLPNRSLFQERVRRAMEWVGRRQRLNALVLIDLYRFKDTNDTLGHEVGDALLVQIARRLETRIRAIDMMSRLGGDEFAVLIEDIGSRQAVQDYVEDIVNVFQEPFAIDGHLITVNASCGIALHPEHGLKVEGLFRAADLALQKAKEERGNAHRFFEAEMDRETTDRMRIARDLRSSFENKSLWIAWQPQVNLNTGQIVGAEALLRWNHKNWENLTAARVIGVAEDTGIIHQLGDWVIGEVCLHAHKWKEAGLPQIRFSLNLSPTQITRSGAGQRILDTLTREQVSPEWIQVEITESVLLEASDFVNNNLEQLRRAGVGIVLDDFGTGYSSLTYLRHHPVRSLKIDLSFVQGVGRNSNDERIIAGLIDMAHALGIEVCAEGVETAEQIEFLQLNACDSAQGFYFARPMNGEALADWVRRYPERSLKAAGGI